MTTTPRPAVRAAAALTVLAAALLAGLPARSTAQASVGGRPAVPSVPATGTELFRGLLHLHKIKPATLVELNTPEIEYRNLIVVVLGRSNPTDTRHNYNAAPLVREVLQAGGAVLIAAKEQADLAPFFPAPPPDLRVTGERVFGANPSATLDQDPANPFVVPRKQPKVGLGGFNIDFPGPQWGPFDGVDRVATNSPGILVLGRKSRYVTDELAGYPSFCKVGGSAGQQVGPDQLFAVGGSGLGADSFRCLVVADPSVFTNQMLVASTRPADPPQNLEFADRVIRYLRGPNDRTRCLFVEAGEVREKFDVVRFDEMIRPPLPVPPIPDPLNPKFQQKLTETLDEGIERLQDRDGPNRALAGNEWRFTRTMQTLALAAAVVLGFLLVRRVWTGRHDPDLPPVPTDTGRVAGTGPPGSMLRRREEVLQSGNYTDYVREYLRGLFAERGLPTPTPKPARKLPPVSVSGPDAGAIRGHLRILWDVAFGPHPRPVTYTRWKELEPVIDAVRRAAAEGRWRFVDPGEIA